MARARCSSTARRIFEVSVWSVPICLPRWRRDLEPLVSIARCRRCPGGCMLPMTDDLPCARCLREGQSDTLRRTALVFDHCDTVSDRRRPHRGTRRRHRYSASHAFQGEYFIERTAVPPRSARRPFSECLRSCLPVAPVRIQRVSPHTPHGLTLLARHRKTVG